MSRTDIVDQSNNNRTLTPLSGLDGYAHKMSEGHTFYDSFAANRLAAARHAGIRYVIAYHVLRATGSSGVQQAQWFLNCCRTAGFDVTHAGNVVMNDWEGWSDGFASAQYANEFEDTVNAAAGRNCVIHYGGLNNPGIRGFENIWLADYRARTKATTNPLWAQASVWQWGDQAAGGGDTSEVLAGGFAWLDQLAGYVPDPPATGDHLMAQLIGFVNVTDNPDGTGGTPGALVFGSDGNYYRYDYHPGAAFFAFTQGHVGTADYANLPLWNAANDAAWLGQHLGISAGGGPAPKGVNIQSIPGLATVTY
jgi:hypothetical protein